MGCNAHVHIEVKADNKWLHYAAPKIARDYKLFALMGETRRVECIDTIKGAVSCGKTLPADASEVTAMSFENDLGYGIHDVTVLSSEVIRNLQNTLYEMRPDVKRTGIDELDFEESLFRTYINGNSIASHTGFEDSRIIVWFDN